MPTAPIGPTPTPHSSGCMDRCAHSPKPVQPTPTTHRHGRCPIQPCAACRSAPLAPCPARHSPGCMGSLRGSGHCTNPTHRRHPGCMAWLRLLLAVEERGPRGMDHGVDKGGAAAPSPPVGPATRTTGASPRPSPPSHVARGVTAVLAIAPNPPVGPPTRPPAGPSAHPPPPSHVARGVTAVLAIGPSPPVRPPGHRPTGPSPRPPPPSHVARGVTAVLAIAPSLPFGRATPHRTRQPPPTATVPRCKACHRSPRNYTKPAPRSGHSPPPAPAPGRRHRPTLQGVSPQSPPLHQTRPSARLPAPPAPAPAHRHRPTFHGVAAQSPPFHQTRSPVRPPSTARIDPAHRHRLTAAAIPAANGTIRRPGPNKHPTLRTHPLPPVPAQSQRDKRHIRGKGGDRKNMHMRSSPAER